MDSSKPTDQVAGSDTKTEAPADLSSLPIVVVGASAGGLTALEEFLSGIPATIDAAIVVIQHLSPDYRSFLDQLLQRHTRLTVKSIQDGMLIETKNVYVLPPNKEAILCQNRLLLTDRSQERTVIYPIDDFLRSLANESRKQAIGVIFSALVRWFARCSRTTCLWRFVIAQTPETAAFLGHAQECDFYGCGRLSSFTARSGQGNRSQTGSIRHCERSPR